MDEHLNQEQRIIEEAERVITELGAELTPFQKREILRDARRYINEGMDWRVATDCAVTIVLHLYGQDPPWTGK